MKVQNYNRIIFHNKKKLLVVINLFLAIDFQKLFFIISWT